MVKDLDPLAAASGLEEFSFTILLSRNRNQKIASLGPLTVLRNLRSLTMIGVVAADGDLSPLFGLDRLQSLRIPFFYSLEQIGRLAGAVPLTAAVELPAIREGKAWQPCERCGCERDVFLIGRRRNAFRCPECDTEAIERHIKEFDRYREMQVAERLR